MPSIESLTEILRGIYSNTSQDVSERTVKNLFPESGFYDALSYEGTGMNTRSEFTLHDDRRPDHIMIDTKGVVTAVYEFKTTGRDLPPHETQLFHYMENLKAGCGVLTNGEGFGCTAGSKYTDPGCLT